MVSLRMARRGHGRCIGRSGNCRAACDAQFCPRRFGRDTCRWRNRRRRGGVARQQFRIVGQQSFAANRHRRESGCFAGQWRDGAGRDRRCIARRIPDFAGRSTRREPRCESSAERIFHERAGKAGGSARQYGRRTFQVELGQRARCHCDRRCSRRGRVLSLSEWLGHARHRRNFRPGRCGRSVGRSTHVSILAQPRTGCGQRPASPGTKAGRWLRSARRSVRQKWRNV